MSPDDLASRHPRLFHVTEPEALEGIMRHGLLPTCQLLALFEVTPAERQVIERQRRPQAVRLVHPVHGSVTITDNVPLSEAALGRCLDDGLTPGDWLSMLNARVFFWPSMDGADRQLGARLNRGRKKIVLVLDTLKLARRHGPLIELAAINTGSTIRRPARRGRSTFTPLAAYDYAAWRRLRGGLDVIREVTVRGAVTQVRELLVEVRRVPPRTG